MEKGFQGKAVVVLVPLLLENLAQAIPAMGPNPRVISDEIFSTAPISIGGVSISFVTLLTVLVSVVLMIGLNLFVMNSRTGKAMRAAIAARCGGCWACCSP